MDPVRELIVLVLLIEVQNFLVPIREFDAVTTQDPNFGFGVNTG